MGWVGSVVVVVAFMMGLGGGVYERVVGRERRTWTREQGAEDQDEEDLVKAEV